jgi:hypothetical protein
MRRHTYDLTDEPTTKQYRQLLEFGIDYCSSFQLVVRDTIDFAESAQIVLERMMPFLVSKSAEAGWRGTKLLSGTADVYTFGLTKETARVLIDAAPTLYAWRQPRLPEDLCLVRADGDAFLVTISHERDGYLLLSSDEKALLDAAVPNMDLIEQEA